MKNILKSIISTIIAASLTLGFAGCGSNVNTESALIKVSKATLKVAVYLYGDDLITFQNILKKLNTKSTFYDLQIQDIPVSSYYSELNNLISANKAPDLMMCSVNIGTFIKQRTFLDITEQVMKDKNLKIQNFFKSTMDTVTYNKRIYGLPFQCINSYLFYNKDLFNAAGIPYPNNNWKWEDFNKTAKEFTKDTNGDGKIEQWGIFAGAVIPADVMLLSYGGDLNNIQSEASMNALNEYSDILKSCSVENLTKQTYSNGELATFLNGRVAMNIGVVIFGLPDNYYNYNFNFGIATIPYEKFKYTSASVDDFMINSKTHYKEAAYLALSDIIKAGFIGTRFPPSKDFFTLSLTNKLGSEFDLNTVIEGLNYNDGNTMNSDLNLFRIFNDKVIIPIMQGQKTPEQAAKDMAAALGNSGNSQN
jgi:multiple sugar transport system substrate-binding protein